MRDRELFLTLMIGPVVLGVSLFLLGWQIQQHRNYIKDRDVVLKNEIAKVAEIHKAVWERILVNQEKIMRSQGIKP